MIGAAPVPAWSSLDLVERNIFLRAVLSGVDLGPAAAAMVSLIREAYFRAGTVIYRAGESTDHICFVVDGEVELRLPDEAAWVMGPRSVFGVLDASLDRPHGRTAIATEDTHLLVLSVEDWRDILEDHFDLAQAMVWRNARDLFQLSLRLAPSGGFAAPAPSRGSARTRGQAEADLDAVERLVVLTESRIFERAGVQPLLNLAAQSRTRRLAPGEVLFEQGDPVTELFVVARGQVEVDRLDPQIHAQFGPGALVAGPPALANDERAFTARAAAETVVLGLRREDVIDVMEDHFAALRSVLAYLALERDRMQRLEAKLGASREGRHGERAPRSPA